MSPLGCRPDGCGVHFKDFGPDIEPNVFLTSFVPNNRLLSNSLSNKRDLLKKTSNMTICSTLPAESHLLSSFAK